MGIVKIIKPALFLYECFRVFIVAVSIAFLKPEPGQILWLVISAPSALFPLMALFIWINVSQYKAYIPLYLAGKIIGLFILIIWFFMTGGSVMTDNQFVTLQTGFISGVRFLLISFDFFAAAAALYIAKKTREQDSQEIIMEEK